MNTDKSSFPMYYQERAVSRTVTYVFPHRDSEFIVEFEFRKKNVEVKAYFPYDDHYDFPTITKAVADCIVAECKGRDIENLIFSDDSDRMLMIALMHIHPIEVEGMKIDFNFNAILRKNGLAQ